MSDKVRQTQSEAFGLLNSVLFASTTLVITGQAVPISNVNDPLTEEFISNHLNSNV